MSSILISGASIARPTLACLLPGWDVTVLERADRPRTEGQNIDVRGVGRQVLRRMPTRGRRSPATSRCCARR